jgi:hypothetical protein
MRERKLMGKHSGALARLEVKGKRKRQAGAPKSTE